MHVTSQQSVGASMVSLSIDPGQCCQLSSARTAAISTVVMRLVTQCFVFERKLSSDSNVKPSLCVHLHAFDLQPQYTVHMFIHVY